MEFLFLIIGVVLGAVSGFLLGSRKASNVEVVEDAITVNPFEEKWRELDKENGVLQDRLDKSLEFFQVQKADLEEKQATIVELHAEKSRLAANLQNLEEKLSAQKQEMEQLQQKFTTEFENIASRILKQNTTDFVASNSKSLDQILNPLKEKLVSFEKKVDDTHREELRDKASLKQEVLNLMELNKKLSEDAQSLTNALKGDNKQQGNWGELVLERVLERSGLIKGEEYMTQHSTETEESSRSQPDVVVFLPDNKHIIIDAKVSLVHYERLVATDDEEERKAELRNHLTSVRGHIKNLSSKRYHTGKDLHSPDFVLLFFAVEPSFNLAIREDQELFNYAWDQNIVLVSPTTLLATLRTISSVWKLDRQNKNVLEIAREGGLLYDKFIGLLKDLEDLNKHIDHARKSYDETIKKLSTGNGNLVSKVEKLRTLGVKAKKQLPERFALENENLLEE